MRNSDPHQSSSYSIKISYVRPNDNCKKSKQKKITIKMILVCENRGVVAPWHTNIGFNRNQVKKKKIKQENKKIIKIGKLSVKQTNVLLFYKARRYIVHN